MGTFLPPFTGRRDLLCVGKVEPDMFFPEPANVATTEPAKALCRRCHVVTACAQWATEQQIPYGVWGATTPADRNHGRAEPDVEAETRLAQVFAAAHHHLATGAPQKDLADQYGIGTTVLTEAVAVLKHAPHLEKEVVVGTITSRGAYRYALTLKGTSPPLTGEQVAELAAAIDGGESIRSAAGRYGRDPSTVARTVDRWRRARQRDGAA